MFFYFLLEYLSPTSQRFRSSQWATDKTPSKQVLQPCSEFRGTDGMRHYLTEQITSKDNVTCYLLGNKKMNKTHWLLPDPMCPKVSISL